MMAASRRKAWNAALNMCTFLQTFLQLFIADVSRLLKGETN